jgi:hypothetical protein
MHVILVVPAEMMVHLVAEYKGFLDAVNLAAFSTSGWNVTILG